MDQPQSTISDDEIRGADETHRRDLPGISAGARLHLAAFAVLAQTLGTEFRRDCLLQAAKAGGGMTVEVGSDDARWLAEKILALRSTPGVQYPLERIRTARRDIRAAAFELSAGYFLKSRNVEFSYREKGYDIDIIGRGTIVRLEAKAKMPETTISSGTIEGTLKEAEFQLGAGQNGVVFLQVSETWTLAHNFDYVLLPAINKRLRSEKRGIAGVLVFWESRAADGISTYGRLISRPGSIPDDVETRLAWPLASPPLGLRGILGIHEDELRESNRRALEGRATETLATSVTTSADSIPTTRAPIRLVAYEWHCVLRVLLTKVRKGGQVIWDHGTPNGPRITLFLRPEFRLAASVVTVDGIEHLTPSGDGTKLRTLSHLHLSVRALGSGNPRAGRIAIRIDNVEVSKRDFEGQLGDWTREAHPPILPSTLGASVRGDRHTPLEIKGCQMFDIEHTDSEAALLHGQLAKQYSLQSLPYKQSYSTWPMLLWGRPRWALGRLGAGRMWDRRRCRSRCAGSELLEVEGAALRRGERRGGDDGKV